MTYYYLQPKYFSDFNCIGSDCPANCCYGWRIDWTEEEYTRLIRADLPQNLRTLCDQSFINNNYYGTDKKMYMIKFLEDGRCPFLERNTGLCGIQKAVGEEYLSTTCITYPRRIFKRENIFFRSCNTSCVHIIEMLLNDCRATELEKRIAHDVKRHNKYSVKYDTVEDIHKMPYLKYRMEILEFYSDLFNSTIGVENAIVLGALAAKHISGCNIAKDDINNILSKYQNKDNAELVRSLEDITPNYNIKFLISNNIVKNFFSDKVVNIDLSVLNYNNEFDSKKYLIGKNNFECIFEKQHWFLRNIATNLFYELFIHLSVEFKSFFDFYILYSSYFSLIQILSASIGYSSMNIKKDFIISLANLSRGLAHGEQRSIEVLNYIKGNRLDSPAHLAILVK